MQEEPAGARRVPDAGRGVSAHSSCVRCTTRRGASARRLPPGP